MRSILCIGGPIDGETRVLESNQSCLRVMVAPPLTFPQDCKKASLDASEIGFTEVIYRRLKLETGLEYLYYETEGASTAFRKLLACYAPRLAKLAQDEQRRIDRQIPPSSLQTEG